MARIPRGYSGRKLEHLLSTCFLALVVFSSTMVAGVMMPRIANAQPLNADTHQSAITTTDSSSAASNTCTEQMANEMHQKSSVLDNPKAISLAVQNAEYQSRVQGYVPKFNSIYNDWKFDTANCHAIEWLSVNVVHSLYDVNGNYIKNVVVTLDPELTHVASISEHIGAVYSPSQDHAPNWAAQEYTASSFSSSSPPTKNIWEAKGSWTLPSVSPPTDLTYPCRTDTGYHQPCDLAIWTGLEDDFEAKNTGDHIAQAGSDEKITCTSSSSCTTEYFLWYEFFTNETPNTSQATDCTGFTLNPGDGVQAIVTSHGKTGGSAALYDVSVINTSTGVGCGTTNVIFAMSDPIIAAFVDERAKYDGSNYATLAEFNTGTSGTDAITGHLYYDGSSKGISAPQINDWYNEIRMVKTVLNIDYASVSGNIMTFTYGSSVNTGI